jgi:hypothetical protein
MQFSLDYSVPSLADFYTGNWQFRLLPKHTGRLPLSGDQEKSSVPPVMIYSNEPGLVPTSTIMERINYRHSVYSAEHNLLQPDRRWTISSQKSRQMCWLAAWAVT